MKKRKVAIVSDHAGFFMKEKLILFLKEEKYEVKDFGPFNEESVDYPDYAHPLAKAVSEGEYETGISICGTGNGINIVVNKHPGIRGALCWNDEISRLARAHNDANICALPARFISESEAFLIVKTFLGTPFEGGRHKRRIDKISLKFYQQMLSNSCRYGIRAVIYLATQPKSAGKTGIKQISDDLGLPSPFLAKILQELAKQKILLSSKGPHGGFALMKDPKRIKLLDIVRAIDGDEFFTDCVMHGGPCGGRKNNRKYCPLHEDYQKIRNELISLFSTRTIADLVVVSGSSELIVI